MSTRAEQKEKRRQEILEAGLDLFIRKGFAATKIADIAERAGMSAGLMFHYFETKEKLYEELIRIGLGGPRSVLPDTAAVDPIAYFENTAQQILYTVKSEPFVAKMFVLMGQTARDEAVSPELRELISQNDAYAASIALIEAGQKGKTIRDGNPYALATAYWAAIQGVAEVIALRSDSPCPEAEWIADILRRKPE